MRTDWQKIESDYMAGSLSYAAIAQKYGVSPRQVAEHGRKNDWPKKRQEYRSKVATRAAQKSIYKKSERVARRLAEVDEAAGKDGLCGQRRCCSASDGRALRY